MCVCVRACLPACLPASVRDRIAAAIECVCVCACVLVLQGGGKGAAVLQEGQLVDLWERMNARVAELMEGAEPLPRPALPFDAASDLPVEEQK